MNDNTVMQQSVLLQDPKIMEMARREARAFVKNYRPWGMDEEDVENRILFALWDAEWALMAVGDAHSRALAIRAVVSSALGKARDLSRANRARIQPFPVSKVAARHGDVRKACARLAQDYAAFVGNDERARRRARDRYVKSRVIPLLGPKYAGYCYEYLDEDADTYGSWDAVAVRHGIRPTTFRHRELRAMARLGRAIWRKIGGGGVG